MNKCPKCGAEYEGAFCPNGCNAPKICPKCGTQYTGNFCPKGCNSPNKPKKGLKTWQIVLIVIGVLFVIGIIVGNTVQNGFVTSPETTTRTTITTKQTTQKETTEVQTTKSQKEIESSIEAAKHILTDEERSQLKAWAKETVLNNLKAPSTAEFPGGWLNPYEGWGFSKDGDDYKVSGYVDSQNSFGAMIRSNFYMEIHWDKETGKANISNISIQ